MYRIKNSELKQWKISKKRKPLVFLGARQVGKTYLIQEFGKSEYKQMAYVNYEDAPQYHIIAAGSLLGVNIHPDESFPVGKVDFMRLFPMSFFEFLLAMDETGVAELLGKRDLNNLQFFHAKLINLLRYYLYVGGMPEAMQEFVENRDWQEVRKIQNQISNSIIMMSAYSVQCRN